MTKKELQQLEKEIADMEDQAEDWEWNPQVYQDMQIKIENFKTEYINQIINSYQKGDEK